MAKDLKDKIKDAWISETPDFRESIIAACEKEEQVLASSPVSFAESKRGLPLLFRRLIAVAACAVTFGVGLLVGKGTTAPIPAPTAEAETHVYLDVNPSLELSLDKENTVLSCAAANEDAESILNGMQLEGAELKTALNAIVGSMYVKGYLTESEKSMLISVDTNDESKAEDFLTYITEQVNEVFADSEMECAIIAQEVNADVDLKSRAEEQGISVGKMHLLDKMVEGMEDLTENDLSKLVSMSIKDLNLIYSTKPNDDDKPNKEVISGSVSVGVATDGALNAVLTEMGKTADDVEEYRIFILPSMSGRGKVVYVVTLKLHGDGATYRYEVDCQTGEVTALLGDKDSDKEPPEGGGANEGDKPSKEDGKEENQKPDDGKDDDDDDGNPFDDWWKKQEDTSEQNGRQENRP